MSAAPVFLLVEPSSFVRSSLHEWLENVLSGYRILVAGTAEEALRLAAQERPTHILIETYLPNSPGFEILKQMRQSLPAARIIATHWHESRHFLKELHSAGVDEFVPKDKLYIDLLPLLK